MLVTRSLAAFVARRPPEDLYAVRGGLMRLSLDQKYTELLAVSSSDVPMPRPAAARCAHPQSGCTLQSSRQGTYGPPLPASGGTRVKAACRSLIAAAG